jgi:hypothetical protein
MDQMNSKNNSQTISSQKDSYEISTKENQYKGICMSRLKMKCRGDLWQWKRWRRERERRAGCQSEMSVEVER